MPHVLTRIKVEDYAQWKSRFSGAEGTAMREAAGAKSYQIFCTEDDSNHLIILFEWDI